MKAANTEGSDVSNVLMGLTAYIDESGTHDDSPIMTVGGYLSTGNAWDSFDSEWTKILADLGSCLGTPLYYFHMTDFIGNYRLYAPLRKDGDTKALVQQRVLDTIKSHTALAIGVTFKASDYHDIVGEYWKRTFISPYTFAVQMCVSLMGLLAKKHGINEPIAYVIEEGSRHQGPTDALLRAFGLTREISEAFNYGGHSFADKREVQPLQAADALVYEVNRYFRHAMRYEERRTPHWKVHPQQWTSKGEIAFLKRSSLEDIMLTTVKMILSDFIPNDLQSLDAIKAFIDNASEDDASVMARKLDVQAVKLP